MMRKLALLFLLITLLAGAALAQDATATPAADTTTTTTDNASSVAYFFAACETQAVVDFTGFMEPGFDLYIQVFKEWNATGQPLSSLLRVPVNNTYEVSQTIPYTGGEVLALGQFASARISIASESDPQREVFSEVVNETQDTCIEPSYPTVDSVDAGTGAGGTGFIDPETGEVIVGDPNEPIRTSGIFTPGGGVLNEVFAIPQEAVVQIGARPSENERVLGRVSDPGLLFAECDDFPLADPGVLFDTDNLTVFWSWFAATPEQVREHIRTAQYEVFLDSAYAGRQIFPNVEVTPVVRREDGNFYVFYVARLGDGFKPGDYSIAFYLTWPTVISDGYAEFGPGTETPFMQSSCTFTVEPNPYGVDVDRKNPTIPLQVNISG